MSDGGQYSGSWDALPVLKPQLYYVTAYIRDFLEYFDTTRFSKLTTVGTALVVSHVPVVGNKAVGAWRKLRKPCLRQRASGSHVACSEMDSILLWCREKDEHQRLLAGLLR